MNLDGLRRSPTNLRAALWMMAAAFVFSQMGGLVKYLGQDLHGFEIAFFRSIFGLFALIPLMIAEGGRKAFVTKRPVLHAVRAIFGGVTMLCFFYAMTQLPLATAVSLMFSQPLFMLMMAPFFLNETVGWHRRIAVAIGFCGVLTVIQPGSIEISVAAVAAVFGAFTMACAMIAVKTLSRTDSSFSILVYFAISCIVVTAVPTYYVWKPPSWGQIGLLAIVGTLASFGQYLYLRSYKLGEASFVAPFNYTQLLFAATIGYFAFGEVPKWTTLVGGGIIIASAIYIMRREALVKKRQVTSVHSPGSG